MGLCNCCFSEEERDAALENVRKLREKVLCGDFVCAKEILERWMKSQDALVVFVSSTFTDTMNERNILLQEILPELRKKGREQGVEARFVDMRYGIRDGSTDRHLTWKLCVEQLEKCFRESAGIAFISLQGDKYGYMPLSREIMKDDYERCYRDFSKGMKKVADEWYHYDENTGCYILRNLYDLNPDEKKKYYDVVLPLLREGFNTLIFNPELYPDARIGNSVSEWEARQVLSDPSRMQRSIWAHRMFQFSDTDFSHEKMKDYSERDTETLAKLGNLHEEMKGKFGKGKNHFEFSISWRDYMDQSGQNANKNNYLKKFETSMMTVLQNSIDHIVERSKEWDLNAHGLGLSGTDVGEMLHHYVWANIKVSSYVPRSALTDECQQVIAQSNRCDTTSVIGRFDFSGISVALVGPSGVGKTATMAILAHMSYEKNRNVPVLIRFCGTSRGSNTGLELMRSLCMQIIFLYKTGNMHFTGELNEDNASKLTYESIPALYDDMV